MEILNLTQGSPEWLAHRLDHFNASEAPVVMGESKKTSRDELLYMKATRSEKEFSDYVVKNVLQSGHDAEAAARPIIEKQFDIELSPMTIKNGIYSMSSDGLNDVLTIGWEHKVYNKELFALVCEAKEPKEHIWQMEHFFLVIPTLKEVIFTVSDGTEDNIVSIKYKSKPARRKKLIAAWDLFAKDLANYVVPEKKETVVADDIKQLPAILYEVKGTLVSTNLDVYRKQAMELVDLANKPLETDLDFVNAISLVKTFENAEEKLKLIKEEVVAKFQSLNDALDALDDIHSIIRKARLSVNPKIEAEKERRKKELLVAGEKSANDYFDELQSKTEIKLIKPLMNFSSVIKGKSNPEKMAEAINQYAADMKLAIDEQFQKVQANLELFNKQVGTHKTLFPDLDILLVQKSQEDLEATIALRIAKHKQEQDEAAKAAAELRISQSPHEVTVAGLPDERTLQSIALESFEKAALQQAEGKDDPDGFDETPDISAFSDEESDIQGLTHAAKVLEDFVFLEMKTARGQQISVNARNAVLQIAKKIRDAAKTI